MACKRSAVRSRLAPPNFKPSLQSGGFLSLPFAAFVIQSISWQCRVVNASLTEKQQQAGPCLLRDANKLIICVPENPDQ